MTTEYSQNAPDSETRKLLRYLNLVLYPRAGMGAAVRNFTAKLLEMLGYADGDRIIFIRRTLPLGANSLAQTDVCVMNVNDEILLLMHENKLSNFKNPEPQVIAEAIAAFNTNNSIRKSSMNPAPFAAITFPAIIMAGTDPIFYKITVTAELSYAVHWGTYPINKTRVLRYIPDLPVREMENQNMRTLKNRVEILACLEAFKQFL